MSTMSTVRLYKSDEGPQPRYKTTPYPHGDVIGQEYVLPESIELVYLEGRKPFFRSEAQQFIPLVTSSTSPCLLISEKEEILSNVQ